MHNTTKDEDYRVTHRLTDRQRSAVLAGGVIPALAARQASPSPERPVGSHDGSG
ncbi:hypothetical protein [Streptomyces sp. NPDC018833]|uniref:hypothetical protein n=1 Tax=Streptomyces sp. NPDC018833 TaxID=3365053 RepID=UPI0037AC00A8